MCRIPRQPLCTEDSSRHKAVRVSPTLVYADPCFFSSLETRMTMHSDHRSGCRQPVGNASRPERSSKECCNFNLLFNRPLVRKTGPHDGTDETKFHYQSEKLLNWLCKSSQFNSEKVASVSIISILNLCSAKRMLWLYWSHQHQQISGCRLSVYEHKTRDEMAHQTANAVFDT